MPTGPAVTRAVVPTTDLDGDVALFGGLGFRLDAIWPADDPAHALLSTAALTIELRRQDGPPAAGGQVVVVVAVDALPATGDRLDAPGGARLELVADDPVALPPRDSSGSIVTHLDADAPWIVGRAGMRYRDLVPGRLGGRYIASHIEIPDGGEVPDYVHFHDVVFQMIFCAAGWVRVVYEDQGEPFVLRAGDCVLQPPLIRHRVLEASEGLEVIEIGCPAEHLTRRDHALGLPTSSCTPSATSAVNASCATTPTTPRPAPGVTSRCAPATPASPRPPTAWPAWSWRRCARSRPTGPSG
jgi:quercetin dioxygenase-like cupin family protein